MMSKIQSTGPWTDPVVRGTDLSVCIVFNLVSSGLRNWQIIEMFPFLTEQDIEACIEWAINDDSDE